MQGKNVRVRSSEGGEFDCYLAPPRAAAKVPAIVIASAVHGVNADVRAIADDFASQGFLAAAPDLFWRSIPGPLARDDERTKQRSQPRLAKIKLGEADLADMLAGLRKEPLWNGRAAVIGLCYGGGAGVPGGAGGGGGRGAEGGVMRGSRRGLSSLGMLVVLAVAGGAGYSAYKAVSGEDAPPGCGNVFTACMQKCRRTTTEAPAA